MAERAKLRYHGKAYYDEDLIFIAKKELKFNGLTYLSYVLDRANSCLIAVGYSGDRNNRVPITIPFGALSMYNVGKGINDLVIDGIVYDDRKLMQVGNEVASLWGASCIKYSVDRKTKTVTFECVEHGEFFVTSVEFANLKEYL